MLSVPIHSSQCIQVSICCHHMPNVQNKIVSTVHKSVFLFSTHPFILLSIHDIIIIMLYYRLAEHINKYMSVVQYIVSTLSTRVGIQLLTMSVATMRRAHTATVSILNTITQDHISNTAAVAEWVRAWDTLLMVEAAVCGRSWVRTPTGAI